MDLLAEGQGVLNGSNPSLPAGGDQSQSGASVYVEHLFSFGIILIVVEGLLHNIVLAWKFEILFPSWHVFTLAL